MGFEQDRDLTAGLAEAGWRGAISTGKLRIFRAKMGIFLSRRQRAAEAGKSMEISRFEAGVQREWCRGSFSLFWVIQRHVAEQGYGSCLGQCGLGDEDGCIARRSPKSRDRGTAVYRTGVVEFTNCHSCLRN